MEPTLLLTGTLDLLWKVIVNYGWHGYLFAIAHVAVLIMLLLTLHRMHHETEALEHWQPREKDSSVEGHAFDSATPSSSSSSSTTSTDILDQFVGECDYLGQQGFFVPMTDFSDRLDSIVDGIAAEFHDRANLFIVVGVAGSLLGIFEFAFNSHDAMTNQALSPNERLNALGTYLSESMSKAFPVGFIGLVLTFIAQAFAPRPEGKLRDALVDAIGRALKARQSKSRSQGQIVREAAEGIKAAMGPLENLEQTLKLSVQPAVDKLGEHLDESLKLVKTQFDEMQKTNAGTQDIVREVNVAVGMLEKMVGDLERQAEETRQVNEGAIRLQQQQMVSLAEFNEATAVNLQQVRLINDSIVNTLQSINRLPQVLHQTTQMKLDEAARDTLSAWRGMSDEIKDLVIGDHNNLLDGVAVQAENIQAALSTASLQLLSMANGTRQAIDALTDLPPHLLTEFKQSFNILSDSSGAYWNDKTNLFVNEMMGEYTRYLRLIGDETQKVKTALEGTSEALTMVSRQMGTILPESLKTVIVEAKKELEAGLLSINHVLVQQYPDISRDVVTLSESLKSTVEQARTIQQESSAWMEGVQIAHEKLAEINRLIAEALERTRSEISPTNAEQTLILLGRNAEELKRLGDLFAQINARMPPSDQVGPELSRATDLLAHIRDDLHRRLQEEQYLDRNNTNGSRDGWLRRTYNTLRRPFGGG